jgi:hypothetical protein
MAHAVMKVDDLPRLLSTICSLAQPFSQNDFYRKLQRRRALGISAREDNFFLARKIGLIQGSRDSYYRTELGQTICNSLTRGDVNSTKKHLGNALRLKEPNFAKFLEYLRTPRSYPDIVRWSNEAAAGTLIYWGDWLGLTEYRIKTGKYFLLPRRRLKLDNVKFWDVLWRSYLGERRTHVPGIRSPFVKIPQIRDTVCSLTGMSIPHFDRALVALLDDSEYSDRIELSTAPLTRFLDDRHQFRSGTKPLKYNGRSYYYIGLK